MNLLIFFYILNQSKKARIEYFVFILYNIFYLIMIWLQMDIKAQTDINYKSVFQALQMQLFERLLKIKIHVSLFINIINHYKYNLYEIK